MTYTASEVITSFLPTSSVYLLVGLRPAAVKELSRKLRTAKMIRV